MVIYGNNNTLQSLNDLLLYRNNVYKTSLNLLLKYIIKLGRTDFLHGLSLTIYSCTSSKLNY